MWYVIGLSAEREASMPTLWKETEEKTTQNELDVVFFSSIVLLKSCRRNC